MLAYQAPSPLRSTPLRRRASGLVLAVAINLALLLVLLTLGGILKQPPKLGDAPLVVSLTRESSSAATASAKTSEKQESRTEARSEAIPKPRITLPAKPTIDVPRESPWLELTKAEMAQADIRNVPKAGRGSGSGQGDSEAVGRGPNGEVLYAAEWARRPTDAELGGYLPGKMVDGWGLIACRTVEGNRVEDCIELDQSPRGSHLASAVRQAAWQFRVRPPRKNGRPLIGAWVQILIEYSTVRRS